MNNTHNGYNQEKIQAMNRTLLLNLLRKEGVCSRAHLAAQSHLKQATITYLIQDFMNWNLVKETGTISGNKGRRSIGLTINNEDYGVMAIRLTRQNYSIGIFDLSGKNVQLIREDICHGSNPQLILSSILANGLKLIKTTPNRKILLAGVAIPGPYNLKKDRIALMTGLDGWNEIDIKTQLENSFQIPVFVEQDANCGAIAQYWFTDTPPQDNSLIYIAVGQGIGAGIIYNGEIIHGSLGTAGEIGHASINFNGRKCACGNTGCLETYCSSIVFTDEVNDALHTDTRLSFNDVRALTKANNPIAIKIYKDMCSKLSIGITNLINSLNPSIIVLGDELCHVAPEIMLNEIKTNVGKRILPDIIESTTICTSFVGQNKDSVFHGAAVIAIKELFLNPQNYFI